MNKLYRFIYLNTYSFLLLICGIIILLIPAYKLSGWIIILQIFAALFFLKQSVQLFSTWNDKKIKYRILIGKNSKEFRPESFRVFMQAPCGRLLTKAVLSDLEISDRYKELLVYKEPLFVSLKNNCVQQKTKIYINEDFK